MQATTALPEALLPKEIQLLTETHTIGRTAITPEAHIWNALHAEPQAMTGTVRNVDIRTSIRDGLERITRGMILSEVTTMPECPNCGEEIGEDDNEWNCPF